MTLTSTDAADFAIERREEVISRAPFRVRRVARWSECDPAGVVYTGNFTEYVLSAVHLFRRQVLEGSWREIKESAGVDTPAKAISMVFNGSLWPDDVFDVEVGIGEIRNRTFDFVATATRIDNGSSVFNATLTAICVTAADRRIAAPIPAPLRQRLEAAKSGR